MVLAHQDAWRKHPFISNCGKKPLTGFGTAAAIFSVYLVVDAITGGSSNHSSGHHHSHSHSNIKYERGDVGERPTVAEE